MLGLLNDFKRPSTSYPENCMLIFNFFADLKAFAILGDHGQKRYRLGVVRVDQVEVGFINDLKTPLKVSGQYVYFWLTDKGLL